MNINQLLIKLAATEDQQVVDKGELFNNFEKNKHGGSLANVVDNKLKQNDPKAYRKQLLENLKSKVGLNKMANEEFQPKKGFGYYAKGIAKNLAAFAYNKAMAEYHGTMSDLHKARKAMESGAQQGFNHMNPALRAKATIEKAKATQDNFKNTFKQ